MWMQTVAAGDPGPSVGQPKAAESEARRGCSSLYYRDFSRIRAATRTRSPVIHHFCPLQRWNKADVIRGLQRHGCVVWREGGVYACCGCSNGRRTRRWSSGPGHLAPLAAQTSDRNAHLTAAVITSGIIVCVCLILIN